MEITAVCLKSLSYLTFFDKLTLSHGIVFFRKIIPIYLLYIKTALLVVVSTY